jgi:conjugal transfer ATP-binding protein TraC
MSIIGKLMTWAFKEDLDGYTPTPIANPERGVNFDRFADWLPYSAWMDDARLFVLEGDKPDSVAGFGFALELIPQTGASKDMADLLATLFTYMPTEASIQWHLVATPLIDEFLDGFVGGRIDPADYPSGSEMQRKAELYRTLAERQAAYFAKGAATPLFSSTPYLMRKFRLAMSVTIPAQSYQDEDLIAEMISLRETCATTLKTYHLYSHEWDPEDLINWCAVILNPQQSMLKREAPHINYDDGKPIREQIVAHDTLMRFTVDGLRYGLPGRDDELIARCFSVRSYPKAVTLHAMGSLIGDYMKGAVGYSSPFMITIGIATQDFENARAITQMRAARATQKAESPMAKFMPELKDFKYDWDLAQHAFDEGSGTVKLYHQLVLFARPDAVARAEQSAQAVWRAKQFEIVEDTYMQVQAMLGSMPMALTAPMQRDIRIAQRFTTKTAINAVNMAPLLAEWRGVGAPVLPLWGRRGQAMALDLFANVSGNYNGCVVGTSGSGKSVFLNLMALSYVSIGGKVWIIDIGRSYEKLARTVPGGQYIEFTPEANISLNPWSMVDDIDEDMEMLVPLFAQMISPSKPLEDYHLRQLTMHIQSVWLDYGKDATIDHLAYSLINNCEKGGPTPRAGDAEWVTKIREMSYEQRQIYCDPRIRDMGVSLFPFTSDGPYARYFHGPANIDFDSDFIVLELEELSTKKDLQAVVMFLLMFKITQEMYHSRDQKKVVILDEAWSLLAGGASGDFIQSGYRRARKYNGAFLSASQGVNDYFVSPAAEAALNNADWMFLLRQKPESIIALEKSGRMLVDEAMRDMLMSVRTQAGAFSEVFVNAGQMGHGIGRIVLDPFTLLLVSSKAEDFEAVRHYRERGYSVSEAIEAVLRDRGVDAGDANRPLEATDGKVRPFRRPAIVAAAA